MQGVNSSGSVKTRKGSRLSSGTTSSYRSSKTPSLLNGNGDGKSILSESRDPEASPSQSRSSSAQDSYSTSATTYEETDDTTGTAKANAKSKESKGNVIVSVRVRPDASGSETSRTNGEWALDGRKGVIAYRGKEGGDYSYGKYFLSVWKQRQIGREEDLADVASQIMFSQLMSKTPRSTIPLRNASYGGSWKGTTVQYLLMV